MLVSAFWHGIHPGYYLSFLTIPLCTYAEDLVYSIVPVDQSGRRPRWFEIRYGRHVIAVIAYRPDL